VGSKLPVRTTSVVARHRTYTVSTSGWSGSAVLDHRHTLRASTSGWSGSAVLDQKKTSAGTAAPVKKKNSTGTVVPNEPAGIDPRTREQKETERAASFEPATKELERALEMIGQSNLPGAIESFRKVCEISSFVTRPDC
jgi:hypothetical protein